MSIADRDAPGIMHDEQRSSEANILSLPDCDEDSQAVVGTKAYNLARLVRSGFPVPPAIVVTTRAFSKWASLVARLPNRGRSAPIPPDVEQEILAAVATLPEGLLAVRSSATAEDLAEASFAGQYETTLGVRGRDAILAALERCWSSSFNERVQAYHGTSPGRPTAMAVLIQELVPADAAGVAFTADPVSGDRSVTVVSAVRGLGERLVSGEASPDEWVVSGDNATCRRSPELALGGDTALEIARLASRVEAFFGEPVDIEWAIASGRLYLLQARAITALPAAALALGKTDDVSDVFEPPAGFWRRDTSHFPRPLSPMNRSIFVEPGNAGLRHVFDEFGLLLETLENRVIRGWTYTRLVPLGGTERPAPPPALFWLLTRTVPSLRARIRQGIQAIRTGKAMRFVRQWRDEWQPGLARDIKVLRELDLRSLSDGALARHVFDTRSLLARGSDAHFLLHGSQTVALGGLVLTCRELLGWDEQAALGLLSGLSTMSTAPGRRLDELARSARSRPQILAVLADPTQQTTINELTRIDPDFGRSLEDYQAEFGTRLLSYDVAHLTLAESPTITLRLLADRVAALRDPVVSPDAALEQRDRAVAKARAALSGRPATERQRFERALADAEETYPTREQNVFYTLSVPLALIRYAVRELGDRLAKRGQIDHPVNVFMLEIGEAQNALGDGMDRREVVARREREQARYASDPGPASYGRDPGPPPSFAVLPEESRFAHEAFLWYTDRVFAMDQVALPASTATAPQGVGASRGQYTGFVRRIMTESDFGSLEPGDVLVCPATSPAWSVLFSRVGALITDNGGILSHPAIIAREYGVPAVVGTGNATEFLRTGDIVTVDGTTGLIHIVAGGVTAITT
jgi:phosphohistidine swiveling domain-containing protein